MASIWCVNVLRILSMVLPVSRSEQLFKRVAQGKSDFRKPFTSQNRNNSMEYHLDITQFYNTLTCPQNVRNPISEDLHFKFFFRWGDTPNPMWGIAFARVYLEPPFSKILCYPASVGWNFTELHIILKYKMETAWKDGNCSPLSRTNAITIIVPLHRPSGYITDLENKVGELTCQTSIACHSFCFAPFVQDTCNTVDLALPQTQIQNPDHCTKLLQSL